MITYNANHEAGSETRPRQQTHDPAPHRRTHGRRSVELRKPDESGQWPISVETLRGIGFEAGHDWCPLTERESHAEQAKVALETTVVHNWHRVTERESHAKQAKVALETNAQVHDWHRLTGRESHAKQAKVDLESTRQGKDWRRRAEIAEARAERAKAALETNAQVHDWRRRAEIAEARAERAKAALETNAQVHDWRRRAEIAEARAAERERIIEAQSKAILALEAPRQTTPAKMFKAGARWPFLTGLRRTQRPAQ